MFNVFRLKKNTSENEKLNSIKNILFPLLENQVGLDPNTGKDIKFCIDYSVDTNLDAILMDFQEGYTDESVQKTLKSVIEKLHQVRKILDAHSRMDKDVQYLVVDDNTNHAYDSLKETAY